MPPKNVTRKALSLAILFLMVSLSPFVQTSAANEIEDIEVLQTVVNPSNNTHTIFLVPHLGVMQHLLQEALVVS